MWATQVLENELLGNTFWIYSEYIILISFRYYYGVRGRFEKRISCGSAFTSTCKLALRQSQTQVSFSVMYSEYILNIFRQYQESLCIILLALIELMEVIILFDHFLNTLNAKSLILGAFSILNPVNYLVLMKNVL